MINGQPLLPGQQKIIGDPNDPVAKFYYASMPGGDDHDRVFEHPAPVQLGQQGLKLPIDIGDAVVVSQVTLTLKAGRRPREGVFRVTIAGGIGFNVRKVEKREAFVVYLTCENDHTYRYTIDPGTLTEKQGG